MLFFRSFQAFQASFEISTELEWLIPRFLFICYATHADKIHFRMEQKEIDLTFRNKVWNCLQNLVLLKFITRKRDTFLNKVNNRLVEHFQRKKLVDQSIWAHYGFFQSINHLVFLQQFDLPWEILEEHAQNCKDIPSMGWIEEHIGVD